MPSETHEQGRTPCGMRPCSFVSGLDQKSMPAPSPPPTGAGVRSGLSATTASVVRNRPAIDAALSSAERVTFTGSLMPAASMSTYSPVAALRP